MSDLPDGWARATVTFDYPIDELTAARAHFAKYPRFLDPDAYADERGKLDARLRAAAVFQIPAPKREPKVGEVWLYTYTGRTRPVVAVDDGYVYLGVSNTGGFPTTWALKEFFDSYEFVSEGGES